MAHSGEGELLSGHAVPSVFGSDGPAVRSKDNRCGVRQFAGQARHSRSWSVGDEVRVELAGDVALQAAHDLRTHANDQRASDPNVPVTTNTTVDPPILTGSSGRANNLRVS